MVGITHFGWAWFKGLNGSGQRMSGQSTTSKPGDGMDDGTIFAGISPDTDRPMYTTPRDFSFTRTFNEAAEYARNLNAEKHFGHDDWRVPTRTELNLLYENRDKGALKGTFNLSGSFPAGCYWSSRQYFIYAAWDQRFSDGQQDRMYKHLVASLRCVRG